MRRKQCERRYVRPSVKTIVFLTACNVVLKITMQNISGKNNRKYGWALIAIVTAIQFAHSA
ncbi:MAG: hypothetical protein FWG01_01330 [Betaproteobacteria bacterium]|nr:hypothetical protein [Betaproteobacteria bacterium]